MGATRRRKANRARGGWGTRALVALALAALGVAGVKCGLDRSLGGLLGPDRAPPPPSASGRPGGAPTSKHPPRAPRPPAPSVHLELGTPVRKGAKASADDHLLLKPQYTLSYDRSKNGPSWVAWKLDASWFGDVPRHKGKFLADDTLPAGWYRVTHDDYTGSGFDRGHMVRSEERTRTAEDNKATFLMTNILPQQHDLNAGPWLRLEERCQEIAQKEGKTLFVVAGGIWGERAATIGKGVAVPEAFFKIAVILEPGQGADDVGPETRLFAVVMPNDAGILGEGWARYATTVDAIERRAGWDFLTAAPDVVQQTLEARTGDGD